MADEDYDAFSPMFDMDTLKALTRKSHQLAKLKEFDALRAREMHKEIPDYDDAPPPPEYMEDDEGRAYLDGEPMEYWLEENPDHPATSYYLNELYGSTPYEQSQGRTLAAAREAFRDDEGTFVDKGESSERIARRGNTIYASSEPRWDYEYDPEALRRAERDTRQSKIDYNKELARKEAERTRRGRQDPNPTLGPSFKVD